jgi:hypothetical protein
MTARAGNSSPVEAHSIDDMRAYGPRFAYEALPAAVRAWVDTSIGSPVVAAATQVGGFSPGVAARLRSANGSRAFVKAVGSVLNPDTPSLLRSEVAVLEALGPSALRPALHASYDDGDWVALLLEDVEGHLPVLPWRPEDVARVESALEELAAAHTPCPWRDAPPLANVLQRMLTGWAELAADPPVDLDPWARTHLGDLAELSAAVANEACTGNSLVHFDVRSDNVLLAHDRVVLVDWNWAAVGPDWIDSLCLALEVRTTGGDAEGLLADNPLTRRVDSALITGVIAGLAGMFQERRRRPPPAGLPRLRPFQAGYADALTAWTRERTGWR